LNELWRIFEVFFEILGRILEEFELDFFRFLIFGEFLEDLRLFPSVDSGFLREFLCRGFIGFIEILD